MQELRRRELRRTRPSPEPVDFDLTDPQDASAAAGNVKNTTKPTTMSKFSRFYSSFIPAHELLLDVQPPFDPWKSDMINLTDSAVNAVQSAITGASDPVDGLRIMVEAGGCAGFQYKMGLVREASPDDTVIERGGVKVFVDNGSHELLSGTTIDFVVAVQGSGFTFDNPNAQSSCSCGKSFR